MVVCVCVLAGGSVAGSVWLIVYRVMIYQVGTPVFGTPILGMAKLCWLDRVLLLLVLAWLKWGGQKGHFLCLFW